MIHRPYVVDEQHVDATEPEPLAAVGHRTHDAVIGIVVARREGLRVDPSFRSTLIAPTGFEQAADLVESTTSAFRSRSSSPRMCSDPAVAIERRGIDIDDAELSASRIVARPCSSEIGAIQPAERAGAEAYFADMEISATDPAPMNCRWRCGLDLISRGGRSRA